jgi:undecaprenyl-diphosphatase
LALLAAALVLTVIAAGAGTVPGDVAIGQLLQRPPSPQLDALAQVVSDIGDEFPAMALMTLAGVAYLLWRGRWDLALFLAVAAALRAVGPVLKALINSPRPTSEAVVIVAQADGLGFPSGHALGAALFYSAVAVIAPQAVSNWLLARTIQVLSIAMMALIAWSRVRLGVHWPSDVAGGLLYGGSFVCLLQAGFLLWRGRVRT